MKEHNLIDIIIPVYNTEKYIFKCLSSVVNQLTDDICVYIINDASTDNSSNVLKKFENFSNIKVISRQKNEGLSSARNLGMEISNGEYILFLDSDDWLQDGCLEEIKKLLHNRTDIIIGLLEGIDTENSNRVYTDPPIETGCNENVLTFILQNKLKIAPAQKYIVRRDFIIKNDLRFKNVLHEDQLWSPMLLTLTDNITVFPKYFYKYRLRQTSLSTVFSFQLCMDYCRIIRLLYVHSLKVTAGIKKDFLYMRCAYLLDKITLGLTRLDINEQKKVLMEIDSMNEIVRKVYSFCEKFNRT